MSTSTFSNDRYNWWVVLIMTALFAAVALPQLPSPETTWGLGGLGNLFYAPLMLAMGFVFALILAGFVSYGAGVGSRCVVWLIMFPTGAAMVWILASMPRGLEEAKREANRPTVIRVMIISESSNR